MACSISWSFIFPANNSLGRAIVPFFFPVKSKSGAVDLVSLSFTTTLTSFLEAVLFVFFGPALSSVFLTVFLTIFLSAIFYLESSDFSLPSIASASEGSVISLGSTFSSVSTSASEGSTTSSLGACSTISSTISSEAIENSGLNFLFSPIFVIITRPFLGPGISPFIKISPSFTSAISRFFIVTLSLPIRPALFLGVLLVVLKFYFFYQMLLALPYNLLFPKF